MSLEKEGKPPADLWQRLQWHIERYEEFYRESRINRLKADRRWAAHMSMLGQDQNHRDRADCEQMAMQDLKRKRYIENQVMYDRWAMVEETAIQVCKIKLELVPWQERSGQERLPSELRVPQQRLSPRQSTSPGFPGRTRP